MTTRYKYRFQLQDRSLGAFAGPPITDAGGVVKVCVAGSPLKAAITDKEGTALTNPRALTRGSCEFYSTESAVDLFIQCPNDQFVCLFSVGPDEMHEVPVDRSRIDQVMVIPFHITDFAAATEVDTGFDMNLTMAMKPSPIVQVTTVDAAQVIDVGTDGSGANDPDGFVDGVSLASAVCVKATLLASGDTMGALLSVLDSANAGDDAPEVYINSAAENITITLDTGSDTGAGYVYLPYWNLSRNQPTITPA